MNLYQEEESVAKRGTANDLPHVKHDTLHQLLWQKLDRSYRIGAEVHRSIHDALKRII